jgi:hypothetical protein
MLLRKVSAVCFRQPYQIRPRGDRTEAYRFGMGACSPGVLVFWRRWLIDRVERSVFTTVGACWAALATLSIWRRLQEPPE